MKIKLPFRKPSLSQRGFTLIELVVVVGVLAVLISVVAPNIVGSKDGATAQLLLKTASNVSDNWSLINQTCGTTTAIASSPVPDATATKAPVDVIFGGRANVASAYQNCYDQSKVLALTEVAQPSGSAYNVAGFGTTLSGGGTATLKVVYTSVPDSMALLMAQKYNPTLSALAASDTASAVLQYSTATAGTRTVTVIKQI